MKTKKILCVMSVLLFTICMLSFNASATEQINVTLNGEHLIFDVPPQLINNRTMVPMRAIFEALGAEVDWDDETRTAFGSKMGIIVEFPIDNNVMYKNFSKIAIDTPAQIIDGRTLLPVRAVSESFGIDVQWDDATKTVILNDKNILGTLEINDVTTYEGEIVDGQPCGYGTLLELSENKESKKIGLWDNLFLKSGCAFEDYPNGDSFSGYIVDDAKNGYGEYYWAEGDYFKGDFVNDVINGYGEYYQPNGSYYKGEYVEGVFQGKGILYDAENNISYEGMFEKGKYLQSSNNSTSESGYDRILLRFKNANFPLHLYSNDGKTYLGKLTTDEYDPDSIFNEYGTYGNKYNTKSIWNEYGTYGNKYNSQSAFNQYTNTPPIIVDSNYNIVGYLTANKYKEGGVTIIELIEILKTFRQ